MIETLHKRPSAHLALVRTAYKKAHGDLINTIERETKGDVERALVAAVYTDAENRARFLKEGMKGAGTDEVAVIDCICTATPRFLILTLIDRYFSFLFVGFFLLTLRSSKPNRGDAKGVQ